MLMSWIWTGMVALSIVAALISGQGSALAGAVPQGAKAAIDLIFAMAGSLCLWSGVGKVLEKAGITEGLSRIMRPALHRVFPSTRDDKVLSGHLSANICANFLGLGNAATPMGIQAAQRLAKKGAPGVANDELCRLVVLNTASIQAIPATVAAVRSGMGASRPFDILPAVWVTSICSAGAGLLATWLLGKVWKR